MLGGRYYPMGVFTPVYPNQSECNLRGCRYSLAMYMHGNGKLCIIITRLQRSEATLNLSCEITSREGHVYATDQ